MSNVAQHYTYKVTWSGEDEAYVGTVVELPSLSWLDDSRDKAFTGIDKLTQEVVEDMLQNKETPPQAISDRVYSGKFMVRVPPETHRKLAMQATEENVSLNRLVASKLG